MRALIVDDSSFIREYLRHLLDRMGVACEEAVDGSDALTMLAAAQSFDLMLLDVNMPVMNGLECVKALREARVPIDLVGGTSMGGILGAGVAQCWSVEELKERFHAAFVEAKPLRDYTLPFVSLVSGRKVSRLLRKDCGDVHIEDLPLTFFCVSSNLTTGHCMVHRRGLLWLWLRASVAIPGVLPPVVHKGEVLVDGGTMNNLPVDAMRELGIPMPRTQNEIRTSGGRYEVDFDWWPELDLIGEADGLGKYVPEGADRSATLAAIRAEKQREAHLLQVRREIIRWGWPEANNPRRLAALLLPAIARAQARRAPTG